MENKPKSLLSTNKLVIISVVYAVWIYISYRTPLSIFDGYVCCSFVFLVISTPILIWINLRAFLRGKGPIIFVIFIACVILPWSIPRITLEEIFFAEHQSEFEKVVELARQGQIEHGDSCQYAFLPPAGYEYLTIDECIFVEYYPALTVVFTPRSSRRLLVYAETEGALRAYVSCGGSDGSIGKNIEGKWYICHQDWN
ncbi:MAG: hypothetical protein IT327_23530 [Anaerolineae bacterium]|nr:hypothetical protein [Anaerolineae bacterium]